jgi:hypothetical protein
MGLLVSCGLTSNYKDAQHSVFAKMLTAEDKNAINLNGETIKNIELGSPSANRLLKGKLKALKTEKENVFNFVEIGQWITHSTTSGELHSHKLIDTTVNDNSGNSLSRVVYYLNNNNEFQLKERWTASRTGNLFIQHMEIFNNGILKYDFEMKVIDFEVPKSDRQKNKLFTGTAKEYAADGKLMTSRTFDINGKLIKEQSYGR